LKQRREKLESAPRLKWFAARCQWISFLHRLIGPFAGREKKCFRRHSLPPKKFFGMLNSMNLANAFAASVEKRPGKTAIFWGETEIPYAALLAQSQKVPHTCKPNSE
jgi:hypothetical protein